MVIELAAVAVELASAIAIEVALTFESGMPPATNLACTCEAPPIIHMVKIDNLKRFTTFDFFISELSFPLFLASSETTTKD